MDINLPGISGFEALRMLRLDPKTAHIPVVAVSANAMPLDLERGKAEGFSSYITRPLPVTDFLATVDEALAAGRLPPPVGAPEALRTSAP